MKFISILIKINVAYEYKIFGMKNWSFEVLIDIVLKLFWEMHATNVTDRKPHFDKKLYRDSGQYR